MNSPKQNSFKVLVSSCTGWITLINLVVFLLISWQSGSLMSPQGSSLFYWGAKESNSILAGEYWRFATPLFIHIGLIHFMVNSYSLYALGPYTERVFGKKLFLTIYLVAGIVGNIASTISTPNPSAGASGSLSGIMGAGFWFEWAISRSPNPLLAKTSMVKSFYPVIILNLMIGFMVPMIDHAAHMGGLITGVWLSAAFLNWFPNSVQPRNQPKGLILGLAFALAVIYGVYMATQTEYHLW